eukprot:GGOE01058932.1.p1 GENE.GGOE01058932.1~~GGOE01058932.1.p1  ORF type:complete len:1051 (+),score=250.86 GGOE01058932.1:98-3250(+)
MDVQCEKKEIEIEDKSVLLGVTIDEPVVEYTPRNVDQRRAIEPIPVTLFESEPIYHQGKIITVNKFYMVYGIRSGFMRVIHKFTAKRGLLKGHQAQLMDTSFQSSDSNILASVNKDGAIIVWQLSERQPDAGSIESKKLLHLVPQKGETQYYKRVKWNPQDPNIIFTLSDKGQVDVWCIDQFESETSHTIDGSLPAKSHQCIRPASNIEVHDIGVSFDGHFLASGGEEANKVALWEIPSGSIGDYEQILEWQPHGNDVVHSLHFLGSSMRPKLAHFLITGGSFNREFKVWSLQDARQGSLRLLQTFTFVPNPNSKPLHWDEQPFLNVALVDPKSQFLVICNQREPVAWVVHIRRPIVNSDNDLETRMDYITEYDVRESVISFGLSNRLRSGDASETTQPPGIGLACIQAKSILLWQFDHILPPEEAPPSTLKEAEPSATAPVSSNQAEAHEGQNERADANEDAAAKASKEKRQELLSDAEDRPMGLSTLQADAKGFESTTPDISPLAWGMSPPSSAPPEVTDSTVVQQPATPPGAPPTAPVDASTPMATVAMPPAPDFELPVGLSGDTAALLEHTLRQLHGMQHAQACQWAQIQAMMSAQQQEHQRQLDALRAMLLNHNQRQDESAFNVVKEQRQHMMQYQTQFTSTMVKHKEDMQRLMADRTKDSIDQLRPLLTTTQVQSETRQKVLTDDIRDMRKEMAQLKESVVASGRAKEYQDAARQKLNQAVDAEQQRMQKLLETVSNTILTTIPDQLEQKFEAKLDAVIQKKLLPALSSSIDAKLEKFIKDGMLQPLPVSLSPIIEACFVRASEPIIAAVRSSLPSPSNDVSHGLRDTLGPVLSKAMADQEQVIARVVTEQLIRGLPKAVERVVEAQLSSVLPQLVQNAMTDLLTKMASGAVGGDAAQQAQAAPQFTREDIRLLLSDKEYEQAFSNVLSMSSIEMVEWLCNEIPVRDIFDGQDRLSNPVVLSLIHQLSYALDNETPMKLLWIREALSYFNPHDPIIQTRLREILELVDGTVLDFFNSPTTELKHRQAARVVLLMLKSILGEIGS